MFMMDSSEMFLWALLVRFVLITYSLYQDETMPVKYTDIDYWVVHDGATFVTEGLSPFLRNTYRYTPILAYLYTGNIHFNVMFGKLVMVMSDLMIGSVIIELLHYYKEKGIYLPYSVNFYTAFWLFNPIVINVSTRGNSESLVALLVLLTLFTVVQGQIISAAILYGLAVHFKIYPIIYSIALFFYVGYNHNQDKKGPVVLEKVEKSSKNTKKKKVVTKKVEHAPNEEIVRMRWSLLEYFNLSSITFAVVSASTFFALGGFFYALYGWDFVYETYLYHLIRQDNRHNFSIYFYHIYLTTSQLATNLTETVATDSLGNSALLEWLLVAFSKMQGLLMFLPQALLLIVVTLYYFKSIAFCMFIQTVIFVVFNKVCTVQYFMWYFCLLPLVLPFSKLKLYDGILLGALWLVGQLTWLYFAYLLEFEGQNTFFEIWLSSVIYFSINIVIVISFIINNDTSLSFKPKYR